MRGSCVGNPLEPVAQSRRTMGAVPEEGAVSHGDARVQVRRRLATTPPRIFPAGFEKGERAKMERRSRGNCKTT